MTRLTVALLMALFTAELAAHPPQQPAPSVDLVELDLVAFDRDGPPVMDLRSS